MISVHPERVLRSSAVCTDRGNPKGAQFAVGFGNIDPPYRLRPIRLRLELGSEGFEQIPVPILLNGSNANTIHSRSPLVGLHFHPGCKQNIRAIDAIVQGVEPKLRLLLGLLAQFPSQERDFLGQTGFRLIPVFRSGATGAQADLPPSTKTQPKFCPFAPQGLAASNATMGRSDSRPGPFTELLIPLWRRAWATCALPALPGLPGSPTVLRIHAASKHPGRPNPTLLFSHWIGGRLPLPFAGSPYVSSITRPNQVRLRCGLHPVSALRP